MPEWISLSDGLPKEEVDVLAYLGNSVFKVVVVCFMRDGHWRLDGGKLLTTVTHWMPLPEPPKEAS